MGVCFTYINERFKVPVSHLCVSRSPKLMIQLVRKKLGVKRNKLLKMKQRKHIKCWCTVSLKKMMQHYYDAGSLNIQSWHVKKNKKKRNKTICHSWGKKREKNRKEKGNNQENWFTIHPNQHQLSEPSSYPSMNTGHPSVTSYPAALTPSVSHANLL